MPVKLVGLLESRECLLSRIKDAIDWVSKMCFYCGSCKQCLITSRLQKEVNRKGMKTFNRHVKWWSVGWIDDLSVLTPYP